MARSQAVIGFWLVHVVQRPGMLAQAVTDLMGLLADGSLRAVIGATYPLDRSGRRAPGAARSQFARQARPRPDPVIIRVTSL